MPTPAWAPPLSLCSRHGKVWIKALTRTSPSLDFAVLAAGAGSRSGPLGRVLPKPLHPVGRHPLIERQLEAIRRQPGFDPDESQIRIVVPVGDDRIPDVIGAVGATRSVRWIRQDGAGRAADALRLALAPERGRALVAMVGDAYFPASIMARMTARHNRGHGMTVGVARRRGAGLGPIVARRRGGEIVGFGTSERSGARRLTVDAGIWVLDPSAQQAAISAEPADRDRIVDIWTAVLTRGIVIRPFRIHREHHLGEVGESDAKILQKLRRIERLAR